MGLFRSIEKLGKAAIGIVVLPLDILRDAPLAMDGQNTRHTRKRARKIADNLKEAVDGIDE